MWRAPAWRALHVAWFPFEFIRQPFDAIGAAFDHNLAAVLGHHAKKSVAVHDSKCFEMFVKFRQRAWPVARLRFERSENEPRVNRQRDNRLR